MIQGSIVALVTPMKEDLSLDYQALDHLLEFHLDQGTDGLVIAGTTGESASLDSDEFEALLKYAVQRVDGAVPVIAGTGGAATAKTIRQTLRAQSLGADAALIVTPYYVRPQQNGLLCHYREIDAAVDLPIILYNVPSRTGADLEPETAAILAELSGVVAIKEAVPDPQRIRSLLQLCGDRLTVLSGDDPTAAAAMLAGASGVISVAANVAPRAMARLAAVARDQHLAETQRLDQALQPLYAALSTETNPQPVKWALHEMGLIGAGIRLPLLPLDQARRGALGGVLNELRALTATDLK